MAPKKSNSGLHPQPTHTGGRIAELDKSPGVSFVARRSGCGLLVGGGEKSRVSANRRAGLR